MKSNIKLVLGSVIALMVGLTAASPMLVSNLALTSKIQIDADVVYAYFGVQEFSSNITGLWRNLTYAPWEPPRIISYFIVLKATNPSKETAIIGEFEVSAAEKILIHNGTGEIGSEELEANISTSVPTVYAHASTYPSGEGFGVAKFNVILTDFRDLSRYYPGWSQYWPPNTSRLIVLTGMVEVSSLAYATLETGTIYLFGEVKGKPYGGGSWSTGYSVKQVQLQIIEKEFLYNTTLSENQLFRIDNNGIEAYIETRG